MASLANQPKNINYLTNVQFKFELVGYPEINFFVQAVNLPGLSTQSVQMPFPRQPGIQKNLGVIEFEILSLQFLVDEYLNNYTAIWNWMMAKDASNTSAILTLLSSHMNPFLEVHFNSIYPIGLSELLFDSSSVEPEYKVANLQMTYTHYRFERLINES